MPKVLLIDTIDFESFPPGGTLNFARQMLKVFGNKLALVGVVTDKTPVGRWVKKEIDGTTYDFFAIGRRQATPRKPFVPPRLSGYLQLRRYRKEILALGPRAAFVQSHEVMMALSDWGWEALCFRFTGVFNPLLTARYRGSALLARPLEQAFFKTLRRATLVLATADEKAIAEMIGRSKGRVRREDLARFSTRVDTSVFRPMERGACRARLGFPTDATLLTTCGRLHWIKGWDFLIDTFGHFLRARPNALLCFIGDGQDRARIEAYAQRAGVADRIRITGFQKPEQIAAYLSCADLYVSGSHEEGWATTMIEALSCGLPIVATVVSGAREIVTEGRNGFVLEARDPQAFADASLRALQLPGVEAFSLKEAEKYALKRMRHDLEELFPPLSDSEQP